MAVAGALVSDVTRQRGIAAIERVCTGAQRDLEQAPAGALDSVADRPPTILPTDNRTLRSVFADADRRLVWEDDGNCYYRALVTARMLNERAGVSSAPAADATAGAIAIMRPTDGDWYFHAGAVARNGAGKLMVLDGLHERGEPVALDWWMQRYKGTDETLSIRSIHAGTGLGFDGFPPITRTGPGDWANAGANLIGTWRAPEPFGVEVLGADQARPAVASGRPRR